MNQAKYYRIKHPYESDIKNVVSKCVTIMCFFMIICAVIIALLKGEAHVLDLQFLVNLS